MNTILTGNIYQEKFYFNRKTYYNYYIDCALCNIEVSLHLTNRWRTITEAKRLGWQKINNKWLCPKCIEGGIKMSKVYCKNCNRYHITDRGAICNIPVPNDTYLEHLEETTRFPVNLNKNNDCPYFTPKITLWDRWVGRATK